jgi:hypothetical protein
METRDEELAHSGHRAYRRMTSSEPMSLKAGLMTADIYVFLMAFHSLCFEVHLERQHRLCGALFVMCGIKVMI